MGTLSLSQTALQKITLHAEEAYPEECCGILLGREDGGGKTVLDVLQMRNERGELRERRFLISPKEYQRAELKASASGDSVMGFYHSHPNHPPEPSLFDLDHAWPWCSYVIASVNRGVPGALRSWVLKEDRSGFEEEHLETTEGAFRPRDVS